MIQKKVIGFYENFQLLPAYSMQTFKKIFVIGFFKIGISKFGPNVANTTLRSVAYKNVEYRDLEHEDIQCLEEEKKHGEVHKATSYLLSKGSIF